VSDSCGTMKVQRISLKAKPIDRDTFLDILRTSMEPLSKRFTVAENGSMHLHVIERRGLGIIKTRYGKFWQYDFRVDDAWQKYSVIVSSELDGVTLNPIFKNQDHLVLRIDSGCETGQIFGDMTCECREQLHLAMKTISENGEGMIVHIPGQDGRGKGLAFKLATLWLQDGLDLDTVESARMLSGGEPIDVRTYSGVIGILMFLGIPQACKIDLATNNPRKASIFPENGYGVPSYIPVVIPPNKHTVDNLRAKQRYLGHRNLVKDDGWQNEGN
jgi:3,4-dihydroxy 2-butanone 4-phosphate synthase/GTP cyclohydrolase II